METGHQPCHNESVVCESDAVKGYVVLEFNNHSCDVFRE